MIIPFLFITSSCQPKCLTIKLIQIDSDFYYENVNTNKNCIKPYYDIDGSYLCETTYYFPEDYKLQYTHLKSLNFKTKLMKNLGDEYVISTADFFLYEENGGIKKLTTMNLKEDTNFYFLNYQSGEKWSY